MAYEVLARKWRPRTFSEVVGQEHITRTLQNAIRQNRVGHAYLFVGPRGTGKTTTARIFAKALNCETGIVPEPCCSCGNCVEIAEGSSLDVNELDGASHNRVDHIRDIRQNVQYSPSHGRFKIYIIDEVHMLTPSAWNALLKTLEEPPAHVKFLFATTEPHKVLPTIVSRCQRFDLKAIPVPLIVERLRQIADQEGIRVEDAALNAIARAADGGMRDAQSIFDQMIAFCGGLAEGNEIGEQDVIDVFGLASGAELRTLAVGLFTSDLNDAIGVIQALADHGRDLERVYADLVSYIRNIMVCGVCRDPAGIVEVAEAELQDCIAIAKAVAPDLVQRILQGLVREEWSFRSALNKRLYLEAILARVMLEAHSVQLDDIIARLAAVQGHGQTPDIPAPTPRPIADIPPPPEPRQADRTTSQVPTSPPATAPPPPTKEAKTEAPTDAQAARRAGGDRDPAADTAAPRPAEPAADQISTPRNAGRHDNAATEPPVDAAEKPPAGAAKRPREDMLDAPEALSNDAPEEAAVPETASRRTSPARLSGEPAAAPEVCEAESRSAPSVDLDDDVLEEEAESDWDAVADMDRLADVLEDGSRPDAPLPPPPFEDPDSLFAALLEQLDGHPTGNVLVPLIKRLRPVSMIENVFQLAYDDSEMTGDDIERILAPATREILQECFRPLAPDPETVVVVKRWIASVSDGSQPASRQATPAERDEIARHPFVQRICDQVKGSVVDARVIDDHNR